MQNESTTSPIEIGFVSDEISRDIRRSLSLCKTWGIHLIELREGGERRFPYFSDDEVAAVREAVADGFRVTAVSPGIFKSPIEETEAIRVDVEETLPKAIALAKEFGCDRMIVFGFESREKTSESRRKVVETMRLACTVAEESGITLAVENEPDFWFDSAEDCVDLLTSVNHPSLRLNWDPANMHWGGHMPTQQDFETVLPHIVNLHVKDFTPTDEKMPWRPVGEGTTPWRDIFSWVLEARKTGLLLDHMTIETHYIPAEAGSERSLINVRALLSELEDRSSAVAQ